MDEQNFDFKILFEKIEETKVEFYSNESFDYGDFDEINESVSELIEIKREMDSVENEPIFTTT